MQGILVEIISLLVGGIVTLAEGLGTGITSLVTALFVSVDNSGSEPVYELTVFGALVCVFGGISLAIGLSRLIFSWVSSFGN